MDFDSVANAESTGGPTMVRVGTTADFVPATGHGEAGLRVLRVRPGDGEWTGEPLSVWCVRARLRSN